ncbi:hypothetical protein [Frisingicoccus sp.]|uniref:hypothetical protein n=1 Tax=Frisingicoccus sp. TaxID=1918627 RepID=UPI003AB6D554
MLDYLDKMQSEEEKLDEIISLIRRILNEADEGNILIFNDLLERLLRVQYKLEKTRILLEKFDSNLQRETDYFNREIEEIYTTYLKC